MKDAVNHMSESAKHLVDVVSLVTVLGTLVDFLPALAAGFSIVWTVIRIWESDTVQKMLGRK